MADCDAEECLSLWADVLRDVEAELSRCAQVVEGRHVLPNSVTVRLPRAEFGRFAPVLDRVARELGEALESRARTGSREWAGGAGPFLEVVLEETAARDVKAEIVDRA